MAGAPFYRCYQVRDGGHVAVAAIEPAAQMDRAQWAPTHARFTETFLTRTRDDWAKHFGGTDACVTPVLNFAEAPLHPQAAAAFTVAMPGG